MWLDSTAEPAFATIAWMAAGATRAAEDATWGGMDPVALRFTRQAREELQHHVPPGHWLEAELTSLEGMLLGRMGRADEAQKCLVEGCRGLFERTGGSQEHVRYGVTRPYIRAHERAARAPGWDSRAAGGSSGAHRRPDLGLRSGRHHHHHQQGARGRCHSAG